MTMFYLILSLAFAENCPHEHDILGPYSFTKMMISENIGCTLSANASSAKLAKRRSLRFFKGGQISIFTEIDGSKGAASTGGRFVFILPANGSLKLETVGGLGIRVHDTSGLIWMFDELGNIKADEKCKLKLTKEISWDGESTDGDKEGGFVLKSCTNSIIFDTGFKRGTHPADNMDGKTRIRDGSGAECSVKNDVVFNYVATTMNRKKEYHPVIKFSQELYNVLRATPGCQKLNFASLNSRQ